jgi:chromosomal replication initiation ATPase DnaA
MITSSKMLEAANVVREAEMTLSSLMGVNTVLHLEVDGKEKMTSGAFIGGLIEDLKEQARLKFLFEKKITPNMIVMMVSEQRNVKIEDILSTSRRREHVFARNLCYFFIYHLLSFALTDIGKLFTKDHSSVIHGLKSIGRDIKQDTQLNLDFEKLKRQFKEITES